MPRTKLIEIYPGQSKLEKEYLASQKVIEELRREKDPAIKKVIPELKKGIFKQELCIRVLTKIQPKKKKEVDLVKNTILSLPSKRVLVLLKQKSNSLDAIPELTCLLKENSSTEKLKKMLKPKGSIDTEILEGLPDDLKTIILSPEKKAIAKLSKMFMSKKRLDPNGKDQGIVSLLNAIIAIPSIDPLFLKCLNSRNKTDAKRAWKKYNHGIWVEAQNYRAIILGLYLKKDSNGINLWLSLSNDLVKYHFKGNPKPHKKMTEQMGKNWVNSLKQ